MTAASCKAQAGAPIAVMLACYTAAFDQPRDCLGEELLRTPGGPVAVYGGSRVTMPYAMAVMGTTMMDEYFKNRPATLGEAILAAKRRMMQPLDESDPLKDANRLLLDGVASIMSPSRELLDEERREHLHLFNLLGDPMLRLAHPAEIKLEAPREAVPGEKLQIAGTSPLVGRGVLELVCRRDHVQVGPAAARAIRPDRQGAGGTARRVPGRQRPLLGPLGAGSARRRVRHRNRHSPRAAAAPATSACSWPTAKPTAWARPISISARQLPTAR